MGFSRSARPIVLAFLTALFTLASACLWDRDTLAAEAGRNKDALTILVGGFERNPALYYEMRIKRIEDELKQDSNNLDQYDDIAVAFDRLGKDDEAIQWVEEKRKRLPPFDAKDQTVKEQWYRYYANVGTFWAHRWIKSGRRVDRIKEIKNGHRLLERAVEINPNAHFGREKYQLVIMEWLIYLAERDPNRPADPYGTDRTKSLEEYLQREISFGSADEREQAVTGLTNLIRLGGAWQSPDVYQAIGGCYFYPHQAMARVCELRKEEILKAGGKMMGPESLINDIPGPPLDYTEIAEYERLRKLADKWNEDRTAFILAKLKTGKHPDTDEHFWDGSPELPELKVQKSLTSWWLRDVMTQSNRIWLGIGTFFGLPILLTFGIRYWLRKHKVQSAKI